MKVFISWSGEMSRELAEEFHKWLPRVIQAIDPYFTPKDIDKGARWSIDIASKLYESEVGIFCMTAENILEPWIMFEAGALSKSLEKSRICPILFGIETSDIQGPLTQFQDTKYTKEEIRKLLVDINSYIEGKKLSDTDLNEAFEVWWPILDKGITEVLSKERETAETTTRRDERDILEEILDLTRSINNKNNSTIQLANERVVHLRDILQSKIKEICGNEYSYNHFISLRPNGRGTVVLDKGTPLKILEQIENYGHEIGLNLSVRRKED